MKSTTARCLILACGNTLREDDGVGPWLAQWAEEQFSSDARVCVISRRQWTPELAEDISHAESVLFIDCATDIAPGSIRVVPVHPSEGPSGLGTHHVGAAQLLALSRDLFDALPLNSLLLTIGAGSLELREGFSDAVTAALPEACQQLGTSVRRLLMGTVPNARP
jgi:hydrogenase maturation protease